MNGEAHITQRLTLLPPACRARILEGDVTEFHGKAVSVWLPAVRWADDGRGVGQKVEEGVDEEVVLIGRGDAVQQPLEAVAQRDRRLSVEGQLAQRDAPGDSLEGDVKVDNAVGQQACRTPGEGGQITRHDDAPRLLVEGPRPLAVLVEEEGA